MFKNNYIEAINPILTDFGPQYGITISDNVVKCSSTGGTIVDITTGCSIVNMDNNVWIYNTNWSSSILNNNQYTFSSYKSYMNGLGWEINSKAVNSAAILDTLVAVENYLDSEPTYASLMAYFRGYVANIQQNLITNSQMTAQWAGPAIIIGSGQTFTVISSPVTVSVLLNIGESAYINIAGTSYTVSLDSNGVPNWNGSEILSGQMFFAVSNYLVTYQGIVNGLFQFLVIGGNIWLQDLTTQSINLTLNAPAFVEKAKVSVPTLSITTTVYGIGAMNANIPISTLSVASTFNTPIFKSQYDLRQSTLTASSVFHAPVVKPQRKILPLVQTANVSFNVPEIQIAGNVTIITKNIVILAQTSTSGVNDPGIFASENYSVSGGVVISGAAVVSFSWIPSSMPAIGETLSIIGLNQMASQPGLTGGGTTAYVPAMAAQQNSDALNPNNSTRIASKVTQLAAVSTVSTPTAVQSVASNNLSQTASQPSITGQATAAYVAAVTQSSIPTTNIRTPQFTSLAKLPNMPPVISITPVLTGTSATLSNIGVQQVASNPSLIGNASTAYVPAITAYKKQAGAA